MLREFFKWLGFSVVGETTAPQSVQELEVIEVQPACPHHNSRPGEYCTKCGKYMHPKKVVCGGCNSVVICENMRPYDDAERWNPVLTEDSAKHRIWVMKAYFCPKCGAKDWDLEDSTVEEYQANQKRTQHWWDENQHRHGRPWIGSFIG